MATGTTNEVDDIRRQMAQIRQRLHQDMQGVVAGADAASDWKHYVRLYPWAALGACLLGGFLIVPRKRRSVTKTAEKAAEAAVARVTGVVEAAGNGASRAASNVAQAVSEKPEKKKGWIGSLIGLAMPMALRAAQGYAMSYMENWIAQQQMAATGGGPPDGSPGQPGRGAAGATPGFIPRTPGPPPR